MNRTLTVWLPTIRAGSGADVFTQRLADALKRRGVNAIVTWFPHLTELAPYMRMFDRAPAGVDVIHANSTYAFAFKRKNIPLVVTEHHYLLDPAYLPFKSLPQNLYHRILLKRFIDSSYKRAAAVTTDSVFTAGVLARTRGIKVTRTIPLWVDYELFSPGAIRARRDGPFRLLFVGNASRRKGGDVIPFLARRLGAGFEIQCTGGLREFAVNGKEANIIWLGRLSQEALISAYRDCDAVVVPSRYEGFGYSALEGMACGKPVVGFHCGSIEEVVKDESSGLLCDVDDVDSLRKNCQRLATEFGMAVSLGREGRRVATTVFSEEAALEAYINLYHSLV
ncbi:MAG: glycosyltransferase family 4 protein [Dokdonella sp.]|uniref:glycosyltransferase family 4 protein n=1 Tax=Dokdonella sp. TaxID=2291710 RepID=UPI00326561E2